MGLFPCTMCAKRFRGKALHIYPAMLNGRGAERAHHRMCRECYGAFLEGLTQFGYELVSADQTLPSELLCIEGDGPCSPEDPLIMVTLYGPEDSRRDWCAAAHKGDCAAAVVGLWSLSGSA